MKQHKTTAIVLRRIDFGEADRILTVLTPEGKISLLAKGVRRSSSKLASGIELLSENQISYIEGRGELMTLVSSRPLQQWDKILADYDRLGVAYWFMKIILKITEEREGGNYYILLLGSLKSLNDRAIGYNLTLLWFCLHIADLSGHRPNLETDSKGEKLLEKHHYELDVEHGTLAVVENGSIGPEHQVQPEL